MSDANERLRKLLEKTEANPVSTEGPELDAKTTVTGSIRAALQGMTFGWSDEVGSVLAASFAEGIPMNKAEREEWSKAYQDIHGTLKMESGQFREAHPVAATGLEVAGAVATGGAARAPLKAIANKVGIASNVPALARLTGGGAAGGAAFGAGIADPGSRLEGATKGAAFGAVAAPATALGVRGVSAGSRLTGKAVRKIIDTPKAKAKRAVRSALDLEGLSPKRAERKLEMFGSPTALADLGENLLGLGRVVTGTSGTPRTLAFRFLNSRHHRQHQRLLGAANEGLGTISDYHAVLAQNTATRRHVAAPLYDRAWKTPLRDTKPRLRQDGVLVGLQNLRRRPVIDRALKRARQELLDEGVDFQPKGMRIWHAAKEVLDDKIGAAIRSGESKRARRLMKVKTDLLNELDAQVPSYKQAREIYAGSKAIDDAAELGRTLLKSKIPVNDVEKLMRTATASEKHAFRVGTLKGIAEKLDDVAENLNAARKLVPNKRIKRMMIAAFPDKNVARKFLRQVETENTMVNTKSKITGGSATASRLAEKQDAEIGFYGLLATDPVVGVLANVFKKLGIGTKDPRIPEEIAKLLFKPGLRAKELRTITSFLSNSGIPRGARDTFSVAGAPTLQDEFEELR
jgi:hypothetical protein